MAPCGSGPGDSTKWVAKWITLGLRASPAIRAARDASEPSSNSWLAIPRGGRDIEFGGAGHQSAEAQRMKPVEIGEGRWAECLRRGSAEIIDRVAYSQEESRQRDAAGGSSTRRRRERLRLRGASAMRQRIPGRQCRERDLEKSVVESEQPTALAARTPARADQTTRRRGSCRHAAYPAKSFARHSEKPASQTPGSLSARGRG